MRRTKEEIQDLATEHLKVNMEFEKLTESFCPEHIGLKSNSRACNMNEHFTCKICWDEILGGVTYEKENRQY